MSSSPTLLALWALCALALAAASVAAEPVGSVEVEVLPEAQTLEGTGAVTIDVHVNALIECSRGFDTPVPIVGFPNLGDVDKEDAHAWHVAPQHLALDWQETDTEGVFQVDTTETLTIQIDEPVEVAETHIIDFIVPEATQRNPSKGCSAEGYRVEGGADSTTIHLLPPIDDEATTASTNVDDGFERMQLLPLVLAIALVGVLAAFASVRSGRGGDGS